MPMSQHLDPGLAARQAAASALTLKQCCTLPPAVFGVVELRYARRYGLAERRRPEQLQ